MKLSKKILITLSILLTAAILALLFAFLAITNFTSYGSSLTVNKDAALLSTNSDGIKILQLSDIQTSNIIECAMAYPTVKRLVDKTRPDLIVLTGDNISNGSGEDVLTAFISLMDSFEIPWAPVFGNHDPNSKVPMLDICAALEKSEYCLFKTGNLKDRFGNYFYNLEIDGNVIRSLIFMDSEKEGFTEEQVGWYKDTVTEIKNVEGHTVPSFVFFHIPIPETASAHQKYKDDPTVGSGKQVDEVRVQDLDYGFFSAVKELCSTDALFFGHDHRNNTFIEYEDVLFCYGRKTGITVYFEPGTVGANLITVTADNFGVERVDWK